MSYRNRTEQALDMCLKLIEDEAAKTQFELLLHSDKDPGQAYELGRHDGLKAAEMLVQAFMKKARDDYWS